LQMQGVAKSILALLAMAHLCSCAVQQPIPLAQQVELPRMYGSWYIVATIPNWFERGMVAPVDNFSPRPDGDIPEDFYVQRSSFGSPQKHFVVHDWVRPGTSNAHWRVQVLWPIDLPFLLLYVDKTYRYAMFGENDRSLGWIYSRDPVIEDATYQGLLDRFQALGYDSRKFRKLVRKPEQVGTSGFWSEGISS